MGLLENNKCVYCDKTGKMRKRFLQKLCDRHYRQLIKYGEIIRTRYDSNEYFCMMTTNKNNIKIDIDDIELCKEHKWRICGNDGYAFTTINNKKIYLQNFIMKTQYTVDHVNRNIYDCRKTNLRIANKSKNMMNSKLSSANKSGIKGVSFDTTRNLWISSIMKDGITYNLGRFYNFHDAVKARFKKEIFLFGEFSTYYNKENGQYKLSYVYNNQDYCIEYVNDRICQFRIMENQPKITFEEVAHLENADRGGHGSTGKQ